MIPLLFLSLSGLALLSLPIRNRARAETSVMLLTLLGLLIQRTGEFNLALWRPLELHTTALHLQLDQSVWPYAVAAAGLLVSRSLLRRARPLYGAIVLASVLAANLFTAVLLWTLLALGKWVFDPARNLRHLTPSVAAILPLMAAEPLLRSGESPGWVLAAVAAAGTLRVWSGTSALAAVPALALLARFGDVGGPSAVLVGLGSLVTLVGLGRRRHDVRLTTLGLTALTLGVFGDHERTVLWTSLATLVVASRGVQVARDWSRTGTWAAFLAVTGYALVTGLSPSQAPVVVLACGLVGGRILLPAKVKARPRTGSPTDGAAALLPILVIGFTAAGVQNQITLVGVQYAAGAAALGLVIARTLGRLGVLSEFWSKLSSTAWLRIQSWSRSIALGVRAITGLLEGESGVVWMFLLLLIGLIGLQT